MTEQSVPPPQSAEPPPKKSNAWKWGVGIGCGCLLILPIVVVVIGSFLSVAIPNTLERLYIQRAVAEAEANPVVAAALGLPIEADLGESGARAVTEPGTSMAVMRLELVGPSGRAPLTLRADNGDWTNGEMLVELDGVTIDLVTDGY